MCIRDRSGIERIRLGSLEPRIITEEFVQAIAKINENEGTFSEASQSPVQIPP